MIDALKRGDVFRDGVDGVEAPTPPSKVADRRAPRLARPANLASPPIQGDTGVGGWSVSKGRALIARRVGGLQRRRPSQSHGAEHRPLLDRVGAPDPSSQRSFQKNQTAVGAFPKTAARPHAGRDSKVCAKAMRLATRPSCAGRRSAGRLASEEFRLEAPEIGGFGVRGTRLNQVEKAK